jgi:ABC-2 type transport system ATP-binding protein
MEEADQLADDIVVIDRGHQIAHGTADELMQQFGGERMQVCVDADASVPDARRILADFATGELHVQERCVTVPIDGGARTLTHALRSLDSDGVGVQDVGLRKPTLDDVFLTLTGHATQGQTPHPNLTDPDQRVLQEA